MLSYFDPRFGYFADESALSKLTNPPCLRSSLLFRYRNVTPKGGETPMAKSNAQRQREWRQRQKEKQLCTYGGCPNQAPEGYSLCDEHRALAREIRRGRVRDLEAQVDTLRLENAELRGRYGELEACYAEAGEHAGLQVRYAELQKMYRELGRAVLGLS